jgi:RNA polymerase subunit RPABC4/transcription elongation factor Spt4
MATAESAGKTCVVCGKDVSGQPRVKDAAGHYMCAGECQQKAIAAAKARKDAAAQPKPAPPAPLGPTLAKKPASSEPLPPGGLLGQLIDDSPMLKSAKCESCGSAMPGGSVICTRCGFNTQTGKALKTAVIVEKEKKEDKVASKYSNKYAVAEFGPSFGILFLIVVAVVGGSFAAGFISPGFVLVGFLIASVISFVGFVWGIVDAFRQGESMWGILGILTPIVGLTGLGFLYYMIFVNELKWSRALYLGSIVGTLVGLAIALGALGIDFDALLSGKVGP